jgi:PAS domain S-box-containing protein
LQTLVQLTRVLAGTRDIRDALAAAALLVAEGTGASRCSIVLAQSGRRIAQLWATSDREATLDTTVPEPLTIDLDAHPEVRLALERGERQLVQSARFRSLSHDRRREGAPGVLLVVPLAREQAPAAGVLHLWFDDAPASAGLDDAFLEIAANSLALALQKASLAQAVRRQRQEPREPMGSSGSELPSFEPFVEFFEGAADCMVLLDLDGRLLLSNPRAREVTGYSIDELSNVDLASFLSKKEVARTVRLLRGFADGVYPRSVDVRLRHKAGNELVLSVTFSPALGRERAVLATFRDVTSERKTAGELRRATEFLHRVIDSSVDAIVSADMRGRVLLFNRAAARIFGYEPADVIGKMNVERLYPPGVAREVMRKIRGPHQGGRYRLEDHRVNMLGSSGELIPVNISAAVILEHDRPIGSVGVFTDVRDKLRMEARLNKAQEDLRQHERSLALAELAGTTAHELNQPLTGVIGYAELLLKRLESGSPLRSAAETILSEAERMAEIVRKIGKITKYETRSYLGDVNILDLEKSAPNIDEIE